MPDDEALGREGHSGWHAEQTLVYPELAEGIRFHYGSHKNPNRQFHI